MVIYFFLPTGLCYFICFCVYSDASDCNSVKLPTKISCLCAQSHTLTLTMHIENTDKPLNFAQPISCVCVCVCLSGEIQHVLCDSMCIFRARHNVSGRWSRVHWARYAHQLMGRAAMFLRLWSAYRACRAPSDDSMSYACTQNRRHTAPFFFSCVWECIPPTVNSKKAA